MTSAHPAATAAPCKPLRSDTSCCVLALAAVLAVLSSPPTHMAGSMLIPALGLLSVVIARSVYPLRLSMLYFASTYGAYAWSLGHVSMAGWGAIVFFGALYGGLFAWLVRGAFRLRPWLHPLAFGASWTAVEALRAHAPGMAWQHAQVASFFYEQPALIYAARYVGEAGCNFVIAVVCACFAWDVMSPRAEKSWRWALLGIAALLTLAWWSVGELEADGDAIDVAIVQSGVPAYADQEGQELRDPTALYAHYRKLADEIPDCELALWPESALSGFFFEEGEGEREQLRSLLPLFGRARGMVIGALRVEPGAARSSFPDAYRNVAYYLGREGEGRRAAATMRAVHEKMRLVPGGEALPFWLGWLRSVWPNLWRTEHGRPQELARLPDGRGFGMAICYENSFPGHLARDAKRGASFFAVPSFEGWYRQGWELDQMLAMSVLRAIETGRPLVRATSDGVSCLVRPDGSVDKIEPGLYGDVKVVRLQPRRGSTPAMWLGGLVPWFAALLALFLRFAPVRRGRDSAAPEPEASAAS